MHSKVTKPNFWNVMVVGRKKKMHPNENHFDASFRLLVFIGCNSRSEPLINFQFPFLLQSHHSLQEDLIQELQSEV